MFQECCENIRTASVTIFPFLCYFKSSTMVTAAHICQKVYSIISSSLSSEYLYIMSPPQFISLFFFGNFVAIQWSILKHGWRTFLYSSMGELVCSRATLGKRDSEAASQLQGRIARAFSSNSLVNTMGMTAAIQYILTAALSLALRFTIKCLQ